ncbi:hypothetical protein HOH87_06400 [bacterium]|nr:hypothetical protein [bacterium]
MTRTRLLLMLLILVGVSLSGSVSAKTPSKFKSIRFKNGLRAKLVTPPFYRSWRSYPLLVALHGKRGTMIEACEQWKPVADAFDMILICPKGGNFEEGYVRKPVDDRRRIAEAVDEMSDRHRIRPNESMVVGFSRGGNFAIELGVLYPNRFRNVVCLFGFFNNGVERHVKRQVEKRRLSDSHFYFITGKNDLSEQSSRKGAKVLKKHGVSARLKIYPNVMHEYPPDFLDRMRRIRRWMGYR